MISYGKQSVDESDFEAIKKVLEGDWLTQGPFVDCFEDDLKSYFKSNSACVVSSGTAALHLSGIDLGWGKNDIVITSPITFLATANSIVYSGATPDFVDIDSNSYTIDLNKLEEKIKFYHLSNKHIKAIIGVDFAGHPCDWESIRFLADKYNIKLINDNCHALGSKYKGKKHYAAKYADIVTQSFHPVKHITTGEGGSVLTNDLLLDQKVRELRSHGMVKNTKSVSAHEVAPWYYEMYDLGYNYRITDIQCALGSNQIKKLDGFIKKRMEIAKIYDFEFKDSEFLKVPKCSDLINHSYHLYPLLVDFDKTNLSKIEFFKVMKQNGINLQVHYIPVHLQPFYKNKYGFNKGDFKIAEQFYEKEISLPIYPDLNHKDVSTVAKLIKKICKI